MREEERVKDGYADAAAPAAGDNDDDDASASTRVGEDVGERLRVGLSIDLSRTFGEFFIVDDDDVADEVEGRRRDDRLEGVLLPTWPGLSVTDARDPGVGVVDVTIEGVTDDVSGARDCDRASR